MRCDTRPRTAETTRQTYAGHINFSDNGYPFFVNTNGGTIVEVNLTTLAQTIIATGGSRGDLVKVDPSNGTLLLTQTDRVLRLTGPTGGGFGTVPEPTSLTLLGLGGLVLMACQRIRRDN